MLCLQIGTLVPSSAIGGVLLTIAVAGVAALAIDRLVQYTAGAIYDGVTN